MVVVSVMGEGGSGVCVWTVEGWSGASSALSRSGYSGMSTVV